VERRRQRQMCIRDRSRFLKNVNIEKYIFISLQF
jgi:hypothetical protein